MIPYWQITVHRRGAAGNAEDREDVVFLENFCMGNTVIREPGKIHLPTGALVFPAREAVPQPIDKQVIVRHQTAHAVHIGSVNTIHQLQYRRYRPFRLHGHLAQRAFNFADPGARLMR